jgi:hypothetical protein
MNDVFVVLVEAIKSMINLWKMSPILITILFVWMFGFNYAVIKNKPIFKSMFWFIPGIFVKESKSESEDKKCKN